MLVVARTDAWRVVRVFDAVIPHQAEHVHSKAGSENKTISLQCCLPMTDAAMPRCNSLARRLIHLHQALRQRADDAA